MFLLVAGVTFGTMLTLDTLIDRSTPERDSTGVNADAVFGATEPAKLTPRADQPRQMSSREAEIRRIARQVAEATAARVAIETAEQEVASQL